MAYDMERCVLENSFRYVNGVQRESQSDELELMETVEGLRGIDVSEHQGKIDWVAVKNSGIDFAIIRCGYGGDYAEQDDAYWHYNAEECTRLGIPFGAYLYSYADSTEKAHSEAAHALRLLEDYNLSYPVYLDLEDDRVGNCSNALIGEMAQIFCSTLQNNGYRVGIYANLNWWNNRLTNSVFSNPTWDKWVAQWTSSCTYGGTYSIWQYTNSGQVDGITGRVDMNIDVSKKEWGSAEYAGYYRCTNMDADGLYIRSGPGVSYEKIGEILYGEEVYVSRATGLGSGNWGKIIYNGIEGYSAMGYLEKISVKEILRGDVLGDGIVDVKDGIRVSQYLAGWSVELSEEELQAADIVRDGTVDVRDGIKLAQYLAGWNVSLE